MAKPTYVSFTLTDDDGRTTRRRFQARSSTVSDAEVQALAADLQALTRLSVSDATISKAVDISSQTDSAEGGSTRAKLFTVRYKKSLLRNSTGGIYSFSIPDIKDGLLNSNGTIKTGEGAFDDWREQFDDGSGATAVVGTFYVSDGEELVEDEDALGGEVN